MKISSEAIQKGAVINVKDLNEAIQHQYQGSGSGCVVLNPDGELCELVYEGRTAKPLSVEDMNAHNSLIEQRKVEGWKYVECDFSSGQILI